MKRNPNGDSIGKVPPNSIEAEMAFLGALLLGDPAAVEEGLSLLTPDDFYRDAHKLIFEAMASLRKKTQPLDIITLQNEMNVAGTLESIGLEYLLQLFDVEFTTSNVAYYARIVKEKAILRRIIIAASQIAGQAYDEPANVESFAADAITRMMQAAGESVNPSGGYRTLKEMMVDLFTALGERWDAGGTIPGMSTGFASLDALTGGLKIGDLVIIAGRPAMGKTAIICNLLTSLAKRGEFVLFASLEMTREQVALRMLSSEAKVDSTRLEAGNYTDEEKFRIGDAASRLYLDNLLTDDDGGLTAAAIITRARRAAASGQVAAVVVDYLQEAASGEKAENRAVEVARNARAFKALAKELNCTVVVLSQLNRKLEQREDKRPILSDLLESGAIEAAADVVLGLYRPGYYARKEEASTAEGIPEEAEIICLKNRKGATGTVKLNYFPHWTRFDDIDTRHGGL